MFRFFVKKSTPRATSGAHERHDLQSALASYREQLQRDPKRAATLNKRIAELEIQAGRTQEAVEAYLAAATAHVQQDRIDQAIALYKAALRQAPHDPQLQTKLAEVAARSSSGNSGGGRSLSTRTKLRAYVPLFSEFSAEEFSAIIECMRPHRLAAEHTVFRQGDVGESLFIIAQGEVALSVAGHNGDHVELEKLTTGGLFGEVSALERSRRNVTAITVRPTELLELERDYLEALSIEHPHVWEVLEAFQKSRRMPVGV